MSASTTRPNRVAAQAPPSESGSVMRGHTSELKRHDRRVPDRETDGSARRCVAPATAPTRASSRHACDVWTRASIPTTAASSTDPWRGQGTPRSSSPSALERRRGARRPPSRVPGFWSRRRTLPPRCATKGQGPIQGQTPSRTVTGGGTVDPVPLQPDNLRLEIVLDTRDDPLKGRIGHPRAEGIAFIGWLELMAAVQRLTAPGPHATAGPPSEAEARSR